MHATRLQAIDSGDTDDGKPLLVGSSKVDLRAFPGAQGAVTADGDGSLLTNTVVEGDAFFDIALRFNAPHARTRANGSGRVR